MRYLLLILALFIVGSILSFADRSCAWHRRNGGSAAHYNLFHDGDGDGVGCEGNPGAGRTSSSTVQRPTRTPFPRIVWATPTLSEAMSIVSTPMPTPTAVATALPTNISSNQCSRYPITLKYRSNFRARPGTQWDIVGVSDAGTFYCSRLSMRATDGYVWYHVFLGKGWGWIRGDLVALG